MNLTWHIIKKDTARDGLAILLWALLFVGQIVVGIVVRQSCGFDAERGIYLQMASAGFVFLQVIMAYILVARLVQADALVGTTGFWLTRPIGPARLFAAKLAGALLLFGLLPVLLLLPWWLYCSFGWREVIWTAVDTFGWQLLVIAPAFLVASLTDDLGRVLLWTLLLVIGLLSWVMLLQATFGGMFERGARGAPAPGIMFTKVWLAAVVLVVGAFAVGLHQYLTRRFVRSVVLAVCCLGCIAAIGQWARWNGSKTIASLNRPALEGPAEAADSIALTFGAAQGTLGQAVARKSPTEGLDAMLTLWLQASGLRDDLRIAAEYTAQTWTWGDGMELSRSSFFDVAATPEAVVLRRRHSLPVPQRDAETEQWRAGRENEINERLRARGLPPTWASWTPTPIRDGIPLLGVVRVPNSMLARMTAEPPAYRANLRCVLYRPEVLAELPYEDDVRVAGQAQVFHLRVPDDGPPWLVITQSSVASAGLWYSAMPSFDYRYWPFRRSIKAVNRMTGDIAAVLENQQGSQFFQIGGVMINRNILHIRSRSVIRNGQETLEDPRWAEHTFLAVMLDREVVRFDRELKVDKIPVTLREHDAESEGGGLRGVRARNTGTTDFAEGSGEQGSQ